MEELHVRLILDVEHLNEWAVAPGEVLWLCSPYLTTAGLTALRHLLERAQRTKGLFPASPLIEPEALRALQRLGSDVSLVPQTPESQPLPTCLLSQTSEGQAWAAFGPVLVTPGRKDPIGGLSVAINGVASHPFFADLREWLEETRYHALPLTPELLAGLVNAHPSGVIDPSTGWGALEPHLPQALQQQGARLMSLRESLTGSRSDALLNYVSTTKVFASYKLVILGLLLKSSHGRLSLDECARRFHSFYLSLEAVGAQPERQTGSLLPAMLHPSRLSTLQVVRLLMGEPRKAFQRTGRVVIFREDPTGGDVFVARSLWLASTPHSRQLAFAKVVERLETYYLGHAGSAAAVKPALEAACSGLA